MRGVHKRPERVGVDDDLRSLLHDLRQYVATGMLLFDEDEGLVEDELRHRVRTGRMLFGQLSAIVCAAGDELVDNVLVDATALTDETVTVFRHGHPDLVVCATYETGLWCRLDRNRLHRALTNLLENAAKAAGDDGRVTVEVWGEREHVLIEIGDDGYGFGQVPRGSGVGLLAVSDLVRASNGRLLIHSGPGVGTQVRLALPRSAAEEES